MNRLVPVLAILVATVSLAVQTSAGPEKVAFPASFKDGVLYATVDRPDIKQYRELYAPPEAVKAAKEGKPLPSGTVLTLVQYKAKLDDKGNPLKDANGRFIKGDLIAYTVMEKRTGWGAEYPEDLRNGEWEYAAFSADGKLNEKANYKGCFQCHKPHDKIDFVISYERLPGRVAAAAPAAPAADVTIASFVFSPARLTVAAGKRVTWTNNDGAPHQIVVTETKSRSEILPKGQSHSQLFDAAGVYNYICGLHPTMKGTVEVTR
jgi:plastocyanin